MKIPIKYGLIAALCLSVWVVVMHLLIRDPNAGVHRFGAPVFFNLFHIVMIYLGLRELERAKGDKPLFKEALKTGIGIAFVYGLAASLFFVGVVLLVGTRWMAGGAGAATTQTDVLLAFAGLFIGTLVLGVIYSTVIAFVVAKRHSELRN